MTSWPWCREEKRIQQDAVTFAKIHNRAPRRGSPGDQAELSAIAGFQQQRADMQKVRTAARSRSPC